MLAQPDTLIRPARAVGMPWPGLIMTVADTAFMVAPKVIKVPLAARRIAARYGMPIATATAVAGLAGFREKPA
jgi:hypothetical protein